MPSVRYFNQSAPFWDFIANLESAGGDHPFFTAYNPESREEHQAAPQAAQDTNTAESAPPKDGSTPAQDPNKSEHPHPHAHPYDFGHGFPFAGHRGGPHHRGGPRGFRRGGGCGGQSSCRGPSGFGWNMGNGGPAFDMSKIGEFFASQFGTDTNKSNNVNKDNSNNGKDFTPPADVFDTEDAYIVHISLPGAKKEDVGVNWDADKSELSVAGVIYRPGDEDFLKTLALDERQVGVFERKVRLGSRALPAQVDADAITARMEDGILIVTIPKLDREYVEVKKVDIE